jgi:hypothetical protein
VDLRRRKWEEPGEDCLMRNFVTSVLHQILLRLANQEDEMGGACSMHGRDDIYIH